MICPCKTYGVQVFSQPKIRGTHHPYIQAQTINAVGLVLSTATTTAFSGKFLSARYLSHAFLLYTIISAENSQHNFTKTSFMEAFPITQLEV